MSHSICRINKWKLKLVVSFGKRLRFKWYCQSATVRVLLLEYTMLECWEACRCELEQEKRLFQKVLDQKF